MKTIYTLLFILFISNVYAQTDCKPYVPTSKGTKWEITNYSSKDKETGKTSFELIDKVEIAGGIKFIIKSISYDKKGKEVYKNQFEAFCINGKFDFDMAFKMNGADMQAYENMDIDMDASKFEIPSMDAAAGTQLKDGSITVSIGNNGISMFKMTIFITDRKVDNQENLKTPAGEFKCIKLSQKISTKMMVSITGYSKEWYSENIGMIKSESYDKNMKLQGYSLLTKLEKK